MIKANRDTLTYLARARDGLVIYGGLLVLFGTLIFRGFGAINNLRNTGMLLVLQSQVS